MRRFNVKKEFLAPSKSKVYRLNNRGHSDGQFIAACRFGCRRQRIQEAIDALDRDGIDEVNNLYYGVKRIYRNRIFGRNRLTVLNPDAINLGAYIRKAKLKHLCKS